MTSTAILTLSASAIAQEKPPVKSLPHAIEVPDSSNTVTPHRNLLPAPPLDNPPGRGDPLPTITLPAGSTVASIVKEMLKHADKFRDNNFITGLLGISEKHKNQLFYTIAPFDIGFNYFTTPEPISNYGLGPNGQIASLEFYNIPYSPCISSADFKELFKSTAKESSSRYVSGGLDHTFQKDVGSEFYLILTLSTLDSCAGNIRIIMYKKSDK